MKRVVDDFVWACIGVYGPNDHSLQGTMWEELARVRAGWNKAWGLIGDFNNIRYPSKTFGCESFSLAMFAFSDFIEANDLVDLPLEWVYFTWFRDFGTDCMSRIDRTLVSVDWVDHF